MSCFTLYLKYLLKRSLCLLFITYIRILGTFKTITQVMVTRFKITLLLSEASFVLSPWLHGMCRQIVVSGAEACFTVIKTTVVNTYRIFIRDIQNDMQFLVHFFIFF